MSAPLPVSGFSNGSAYGAGALNGNQASQGKNPLAFGDIVSQFVGGTNAQQLQADQSIQQLVTGESNDVQQVVMAVAQADLSFQLFMEIRNKLIDSYNELMRMQF